jgi:hypothetical protein
MQGSASVFNVFCQGCARATAAARHYYVLVVVVVVVVRLLLLSLLQPLLLQAAVGTTSAAFNGPVGACSSTAVPTWPYVTLPSTWPSLMTAL